MSRPQVRKEDAANCGPSLAKVIRGLQTHIEVASRTRAFTSGGPEWTTKVGELVSSLGVNSSLTFTLIEPRDNSHAAPFSCSAFNADVHQSDAAFGPALDCLQGVVSIGQQALRSSGSGCCSRARIRDLGDLGETQRY